MKIKTIFLFLLMIAGLMPAETFGQKSPKKKAFLKNAQDKRDFDEAELLFISKNFNQAMKTYQKMEVNNPDEPILIYRIGVCMFFQEGGYTKSIEYLNKLDQKKFRKTDLLYYLGRNMHRTYKFAEAIEYFNKYKASKWADSKLKSEADQFILYCQSGIELVKNPTKAIVNNMGANVNTSSSEYVPVVTVDENIMYYTYRGERSTGGKQVVPDVPDPNGDYFEDIFVSKKENGQWSAPSPLPSSVNTNGHDACISLSNDGLKLFMFMNPPHDPGQVAFTFLDSTGWTTPKLLDGDIQSGSWEGSVSLTYDEKAVYFSSERGGGLGKKDLYLAFRGPSGAWNNPKNLGKVVNSEADEDAPFLHPNGLFLIFASNGRNSMGGYDLFYTELLNDSSWAEPVNLGHPINTPGDDIFFNLSISGKKGYYSSDREGGSGMQDIYEIENPFDKKFIVQVVKGMVTVDGKPAKVEIQIFNSITGLLVRTLYSDPSTGNYFIYLPRGGKYELRFKYKELTSDKHFLNTLDISDYTELNLPISLETEEYKKMMAAKNDTLPKVMTTTISDQDVVKTIEFSDVLKMYGDKTIEGLVFKVQIGAYTLPQNFNYNSVKSFGKIEKLKTEDGITRFTLGKFKSLNESLAMSGKVVKAGITDAFVTAVYKGKRVYLRDIGALFMSQPK